MRSRIRHFATQLARARFWPAAIRTARAAHSNRFGTIASSIAFFSFLSLLPFLGAVTFAYGMFTEPDQVANDVRSLVQILPGSARQLVGSWLVGTITDPDGRGLGLALSSTLALYSAMRAGQAVIAGLKSRAGSKGAAASSASGPPRC
jgi:membrane protein